jgi:hypothetical protein
MSLGLLNRLKRIQQKLPPAGRPLVLTVAWRADALGEPGPAVVKSVEFRGTIGGPLARVRGSERRWCEEQARGDGEAGG